MAEAWVTVAVTAAAVLMCSKRLTPRALLLAGLITGCASLCRSDLLLLPPLLTLIAWRRAAHCSSIYERLTRACIPLLAAAVVMTPYAAWNLHEFGKFTPAPVASAVGNSLYLSTWQGELSQQDLEPLYEGVVTGRVISSGLLGDMTRLNRSMGAPPQIVPFNPADYPTRELQIKSTQVFGQAALLRIREHPANYLRHVATNVWRLWNTGTYPQRLPVEVRVLLSLVSGLMFLFGCIGVMLAFRIERLNWLRPAGIILLYPMAVHLWLHTEARYTAAVRPILLMFASIVAVEVWQRWKSRSSPLSMVVS